MFCSLLKHISQSIQHGLCFIFLYLGKFIANVHFKLAKCHQYKMLCKYNLTLPIFFLNRQRPA